MPFQNGRSARATSFAWRARIIRQKGPLGSRTRPIATVDGEIAVKAELTFMVG